MLKINTGLSKIDCNTSGKTMDHLARLESERKSRPMTSHDKN